jgi:hypothetical protein
MDTLTEIPDEPENPIEKPKKRVASQKQLDALATARANRKTKKTALEQAAQPPIVLKKEPIGKVVQLPEPEVVVVKKPKSKPKPVKPTIIQFESDDSSSSDSDGPPPQPTIIIRNGKKNKEPKAVPVPEPPRQYIRRAY